MISFSPVVVVQGEIPVVLWFFLSVLNSKVLPKSFPDLVRVLEQLVNVLSVWDSETLRVIIARRQWRHIGRHIYLVVP
jgi:hypothetical protein